MEKELIRREAPTLISDRRLVVIAVSERTLLPERELPEVDLVDGRRRDRPRVDASREELAVVAVVDRSRRRPRLLDLEVEVAVRREALRPAQLRSLLHQVVSRLVGEVGHVVVLDVLDRAAAEQLVDVVVRIREVRLPADDREVVVVALLPQGSEETAREWLVIDVVKPMALSWDETSRWTNVFVGVVEYQ